MNQRTRHGKQFAIVLAAGEGTRLAAVTRAVHTREVPKQFATLYGDRSMIDAGWSDCGTPDRLFQALEKGGELTKLLTRLEGLSFANEPLVASAATSAGSTGTFQYLTSTEEGAHA